MSGGLEEKTYLSNFNSGRLASSGLFNMSIFALPQTFDSNSEDSQIACGSWGRYIVCRCVRNKVQSEGAKLMYLW